MNTVFSKISIIFVFGLFIAMSSCIKDSTSDRTEAEELAELNELILKLESKGYDVDTTDTGLYYIVHEQGSGPYPVPNDTISIGYEGYLTNGVLFDTSVDKYENDQWKFVYMQQVLIKGLNDGLAIMKEGSEYEFIIPSKLAYGDFGTPPTIGPFQTLIVGVKLFDIKPAMD